MWHGQDRRERVEDLAGADLVLTSYALARRDRDELGKTRWRYVLLDEAQNIKNAGSATAQACKALPADHRLALTGTPLENRLSELWSIFDFLMPGFLGAEEDFAERYEQPIEVAGDVGARERLRRRVQPFVLRRLKTEVAQDLPPKTETVAYCEMEPAQAALYREVLDESRAKVQESIEKVGFKRARVSILAALMRLRQVCSDPRLLKLPGPSALPPSAKLERFDELVDDLLAEGHRALVFSQFTEMLRLLKAHAQGRGDLRSSPSMAGRSDRMARVDAVQPRRTARRSSSSASRPAAPASTSPPRTTSSTTTRGGTRRWRTRPRTAPTASARRGRSSATSSSPAARWRRRSSPCSSGSASWPRASSGRAAGSPRGSPSRTSRRSSPRTEQRPGPELNVCAVSAFQGTVRYGTEVQYRMLLALRIESFTVVEEVEVGFGPGLTVLTGETGAGKSILVDALGLLLGTRADADCVRSGAEEAVVEAVFQRTTGLGQRLEALGLPDHGDEVVLRRVVGRAGRSKVHVNGALASVGVLGQLMRGELDIAGQHAHVGLFDPASHRALLDRWEGVAPALEAHRAAHARPRGARGRATRARWRRRCPGGARRVRAVPAGRARAALPGTR